MKTKLLVLSLLFYSCHVLADQRCELTPFNQFNFLIGKWAVYNEETGSLEGLNTISAIVDGCGLLEKWQADSGMSGISLIYYDLNAEKWQQSWIDSNASSLRLSGSFVDGKMILSGFKSNSKEFHRIAWQPLPSGEIRQIWEMSSDGEKTWITRFKGRYKKKSPP